MVWSIRNIIYTILNLWMAAVAFFLSFRIIFQLFGANSTTPFVAWIYDISGALMSPFANIFPSLRLGAGATLDVVAIISLVAYSVLCYVVMAVMDSLVNTAETTTYHEHGHI